MPTDISAISRALTRPGAVVFAMLFLFDSMARSLLSGVLPVVGYEMLGSRAWSAPCSIGGHQWCRASLFIPWFLHHEITLALHDGGGSADRQQPLLGGTAIVAAGCSCAPSRRPAC
jgi:hypothetical protein